MNPEKDQIHLRSVKPPQRQLDRVTNFFVAAPKQLKNQSQLRTQSFSEKLKQRSKDQQQSESPPKLVKQLTSFIVSAPNRISEHSYVKASSFMQKMDSLRKEQAKRQQTKQVDQNESIIQQNEDDYKNQNETVINLLDDINEKKALEQKLMFQKLNQSKLEKQQKKIHSPSPRAKEFLKRQKKAIKILNDPKAHLQAQNFVLKMQKQRVELERMKQIHYEQTNEVLEQSMEIQRKQRGYWEEHLKEEKRKAIQQKLEDEKEKRQIRQLINSESNKLIRAIKNDIIVINLF